MYLAPSSRDVFFWWFESQPLGFRRGDITSLAVFGVTVFVYLCRPFIFVFFQGPEPTNRSAQRRAARVLPDTHEQHAGSRVAPRAGNTAAFLVRHPLLHSRVSTLFCCRESLVVVAVAVVSRVPVVVSVASFVDAKVSFPALRTRIYVLPSARSYITSVCLSPLLPLFLSRSLLRPPFCTHTPPLPPLPLFCSALLSFRYALFFLVRSAPEEMLCLQNGRFDDPDRSFTSVKGAWESVLQNHADLKVIGCDSKQ